MAPYDWTRVTPGEVAPRTQKREPTRWMISLLVATGVGVAVAFLALITYVVATTITGLDHIIPAGIGALLSVAAGVIVATLVWRGIRARWYRMPAGPADRWG